MFTGIVTDVGRVRAVRQTNRDRRFEIETRFDLATIDIGASIAHAGCCLTVVEKGEGWFAVGAWAVGTRINLERPLKVGDELGGHIVSGHVDGLGEVIASTPDQGSTRWRFRVPGGIARFIAPKGSVAIDGVSLTVNEVEGDTFGVNIIPHTAEVTGFGLLKVGDKVNIEIDTVARYVARLAEYAA